MEKLVLDEVILLLDAENDRALKRYINELNISEVEELIDELPQHAVKGVRVRIAEPVA